MAQDSLTSAFDERRRTLEPGLRRRVDPLEAANLVRRALGLQRPAERAAGTGRSFGDAAPTVAEEQRQAAEEVLRAATLGVLAALRSPPPATEYADSHRSLLSALNPFNSGAPPAPAPRPAAPPMVDVYALLDSLRASVEAADRLLAGAAPPPPVRERLPWVEDRPLIDLFHDLLSAAHDHDGDLLVRHVERLRKDLSLQDIDVVDFDGTNEQHFAFRGSTDGEHPQYVTIRPALVHGGHLLRRGEVRVTAAAPASPPPPPPAPGATETSPPPPASAATEIYPPPPAPAATENEETHRND